MLGLACVGPAIPAGIYAPLGATAPVRAGLTPVKLARRSGRLGSELTFPIGRLLRGVVDWRQLRRTIVGASRSKPALARWAACEVADVERIPERAGCARRSEDRQEPARHRAVSKLAEKEGSHTRAILKALGRGAIRLTFGTFHLRTWIIGAPFSPQTFAISLKSITERIIRARSASAQGAATIEGAVAFCGADRGALNQIGKYFHDMKSDPCLWLRRILLASLRILP